jgi:ArsR family transcriptional regulator, virulence genes transcriptional regulator
MSFLKTEEKEILKRAKLKIRALNHPLREKMLALIQGNSNKMNVTEIYVKLRIEQSVASQHLAILRKEGLVKTERNGKIINYSVNKEAIKDLIDKCSVI